MDSIAWLGSFALAICAVPQAWKCFKEKHADGLDHLFLGLWMGGEILLAIYTIYRGEWALVFNYVSNVLFLSIMYRYKLFPIRQ